MLVVAMGKVALPALTAIAPHDLTLAAAGEAPVPWSGCWLAAAYHPSPRAAIHRPVERQLADFAALGQWLYVASDGSAAHR